MVEWKSRKIGQEFSFRKESSFHIDNNLLMSLAAIQGAIIKLQSLQHNFRLLIFHIELGNSKIPTLN